jgi:hypothetical protein
MGLKLLSCSFLALESIVAGKGNVRTIALVTIASDRDARRVASRCPPTPTTGRMTSPSRG